MELDVNLRAGLSDELDDLRRQRDELEATQASVLDRQRALAVRLVEDEGMTYRDAARLLGLSHRPVAQLLKQVGPSACDPGVSPGHAPTPA